MSLPRILILGGALAGVAWIAGCGDGATDPAPPPPPPPDPPRPTTVSVTPATAQLTALGATEQLAAEVRDQNGNAMGGASVTWASSAASVATASPSGLVTAVADGTATITATAGSASGSAAVNVMQQVNTVAVFTPTTTVVEGDTLRLTATAADVNGHTVGFATFSWSSSDSAVAVVDSLGLVTGVGAGGAVISATAEGVTGSTSLLVASPVDVIRVSPAAATITPGDTVRLVATMFDGYSNAVDSVRFDWSSDDASVAGVDETGLVRGITEGTASIAATADGLEGTSTIHVISPDRSVLEAFFFATGGPQWKSNDGWLTDSPVQSWYGVESNEAARVSALVLPMNNLTGQLPPELGNLRSLVGLDLANNAGMSGTLPHDLTNLPRLDRFFAGGTDLCAPTDPSFTAWLNSIRQRRVSLCSSSKAAAYLSQSVQSLEFPVPLISGEQALLRVFVTAARASSSRIPPVRAAFYLNGTEVHVANIPQQEEFIPTAVDENSLSPSANALIPGHAVQPGLEMVVAIDPENTLDPGLGVVTRIPEEGRMPLDVRVMPLFDLTVIPLLWRTRPDSAAVEHAAGMAADPENHEMLWDTRTLLPVGELDVTAHEPVWSSANDGATLFRELEAIYALEGAANYYMGMLSGEIGQGAIGLARPFGKVSFVIDDPDVVAHELGHNFGLGHTPCVNVRGDRNYPDQDGFIASWGYDFRDGGSLVSPEEYYDLMTYCHPKWIAEYTFSRMVGLREAYARSSVASQTGLGGPFAIAVGRGERKRPTVSRAGLRRRRSAETPRIDGAVSPHGKIARQCRIVLVLIRHDRNG